MEHGTGKFKTSCVIPGGLLNRRLYVVEISFDVPGVKVIVPRRPYVSFAIGGGGNHGSNYPEAWPGVVCPTISWVTERA